MAKRGKFWGCGVTLSNWQSERRISSFICFQFSLPLSSPIAIGSGEIRHSAGGWSSVTHLGWLRNTGCGMALTRTRIEWRQQQRMGSLAGNRPGEIQLGGSGAAPRPSSSKKHSKGFISSLSPLWDNFKRLSESSGVSVCPGAVVWIQAFQGG